MSDESRILVERLQGGDKAAAEDLLRAHLPGVRAFVRLRAGPPIRDRESVSDLVQSVCREVLQHIDRFRYRGEDGFRWWLYTTAMRKVQDRCDYQRAAKRDARREAALNPGGGTDDDGLLAVYASVSSPSANLAAREEVARIEAAFERLPDDDREVILLSRIMNLSQAEVAARMGRSPASVRSLLFRAGRELLAQLKLSEPDASADRGRARER